MAIFNGTVTLPPLLKISKKGVSYAKAVLEDKDKMVFQAIFFGPLADRATKELTVGTRVNLDGQIDSKNVEMFQRKDAGPVVQTVKVNGFAAESPKHGKAVSKNNRQRIALNNTVRGDPPKGHVRVKVDVGCYDFKPKSRCILIDGTWHDPLTYSMDALGSELVTKLMRGEDYRGVKDLVGLALIDNKVENYSWGEDAP